MKESLCYLMVDFFHQLQATSNVSFFRIFFFNQLKRQATIFDKQNQNLRMKSAPTHCPTPTAREIRQ